MSKSEPRVFDFREIAALDDTAESFRSWVAKSSSYFSAFWSEATGYSAQLTLASITTETYGAMLEAISKDDVSSIAELGEISSTQWYASPEEWRVLVAELLAFGEDDKVSEGPLTAIEQSLVTLCLQSLASAFTDAWMGREALPIVAGDLVKDPRKSRLFRAKDLITKATVNVQLKTGSFKINWLLPKQKTCDLLESVVDRREKGEPDVLSAEMVQKVPVELITALGKASLPMAQLSTLEAGQLLMLDQRIDQPITAYVDQRPFYECWPGRLGGQQALQVVSCQHS
ncbi:MAG: FliM/FliN family flagellar motor switch protein [Pirellulaceae bacterium]